MSYFLIQQMFRSILSEETIPGPLVPSNATDAEWQAWILETFMAVSHPIATAAMMRRDLGGVL